MSTSPPLTSPHGVSADPAAATPRVVDLRWVRRPPQQERSRRTMERLVDATERLLIAHGDIDQCTVLEIVKEAGSSVGSFYARFGDKDALMRHVFERFLDDALHTAKENLDPRLFADVTMHEALVALCQFLLDMVRLKRPIIAAILRRGGDPQDTLALKNAELLGAITDGMIALIDSRKVAPRHPDPSRAIRTFCWFVFHAIEGFSLTGIDPKDDRELAEELAQMTTRHLQLDAN